MTDLQPTTFADLCLERIAAALEAYVALITPEPEPEGEQLPEDLPGREALQAAGVAHLEKVPTTGPELEALGIDVRTVNRILTWFKMEAS